MAKARGKKTVRRRRTTDRLSDSRKNAASRSTAREVRKARIQDGFTAAEMTEILQRGREATYKAAAIEAVRHGEVDTLMQAIINAAITHGHIDDNVLNESTGMILWALRQIKAKKQARNLPTSPIPVMPQAPAGSIHGGLGPDNLDDLPDEM